MITASQARSIRASANRIKRDREKRARDAAKLYKQQLKQQEIANATEAVRQYNEYIELLQSVHKDCSATVNWEEISHEAKPIIPSKDQPHEKQAQEALNNYRVSFFDKVFGSEKKKRAKLENVVKESRLKDQKEYEDRMTEYQKELSEWEMLQELSEGVLKRDVRCYKKAMHFFSPFEDVLALGSYLSIQFEKEIVIVDFSVKNEEILPNYVLTQGASGKLSKKNMATAKFNEIYQDYVCSCVLRLAREIFVHLPVKYVLIHAIGEMLNTTTGLLEEQTIVSVTIPEKTLQRLNFDTIDPSDSMKNFLHNMKFNKTKGFLPVEKMPFLISQDIHTINDERK